ncbi:MAG TPA: hypothetical protein VFQ86_08690 [Arachidicoccus soli]|uniref:GNAT family N-acetyltransferase n=1 Tax=Arachidicoccus soli TaxID=2341117 RepID=A0A386HUG8_9BACT|nr:hypothetical protein [Arachidicoccus soli]AYD49100.1 hypothetical protein D6B99_16625 [Arachidicoccus soli]HEU0227801.1 hypothetical protein [Arachidicoccus soli]
MLLKDTATGNKLEAVVEPVTSKDFKIIKKDNARFDKFDWNRYERQEVYKLRLKNDETILGLTCLTEHTDEATNAIEIELLEVSTENIGEKKKLDNIGGCLIAFACREAFKRGHDGCVFLTPKTSLIAHYSAKYGFHHIALKTTQRPEGLMVLYGNGSRKLIKKYLEQ